MMDAIISVIFITIGGLLVGMGVAKEKVSIAIVGIVLVYAAGSIQPNDILLKIYHAIF